MPIRGNETVGRQEVQRFFCGLDRVRTVSVCKVSARQQFKDFGVFSAGLFDRTFSVFERSRRFLGDRRGSRLIDIAAGVKPARDGSTGGFWFLFTNRDHHLMRGIRLYAVWRVRSKQLIQNDAE